jgi:UDP-N-acetyl-D-mannosaminuronate dehydrogenase
VHVLSPALRIAKKLMERGVKLKTNDLYYTRDEIKKVTGAEAFTFPDGLSGFECIVIVAGHRLYRPIPESQLRQHLTKCKLTIDNVEEAGKNYEWNQVQCCWGQPLAGVESLLREVGGDPRGRLS